MNKSRSYNLLLFIGILCLSGCVVRDNIAFMYTPTETVNLQNSTLVSVSVVDTRPYVMMGDKDSSYIGIFKNTFGYPFDSRTDGEIPLSEAVHADLTNALQTAGFTVTENAAGKSVHVTIEDYDFNCYRDCRVWHSLRVQIKDKSGAVLYSKEMKANDVVVHNNPFRGPLITMRKELPKIYGRMIQNIVLNDAKALEALSR